MTLSSELISQFAKITKDATKSTKQETTVYGTIVVKDKKTYLQIDGSDLLTPVTTTTNITDGERVTALIKNHTVIITGNITSPSAKDIDLKTVNGEVGAVLEHIVGLEEALADKVNSDVFEQEIQTLRTKDTNIEKRMTALEVEQKVLWEGEQYMTATHTATLKENVSDQKNGIVLVFSTYVDGESQNGNFHSFFVPKILINKHVGCGQSFTMTTGLFDTIAHKYLYINDDTIVGHADNTATGTAETGITYANNAYVLRYVYGV